MIMYRKPMTIQNMNSLIDLTFIGGWLIADLFRFMVKTLPWKNYNIAQALSYTGKSFGTLSPVL